MSKAHLQNLLLNSLRRKDCALLVGLSKRVELTCGDTIWEPSQRIRHVYFPISGFVSQLFPVDTRENTGLALVGREGMLGTPWLLGMNIAMRQTVVLGSGIALRIDAAVFQREVDRLPELRRQLLRYVYVIQAQLALTATCARFHTLDARLARSLLLTHDRANHGTFHLTHQILGQMLGVRRVGVTEAAGELQKRNVVSYSRGHITVLNRAGLEKASCNCYRTGENTYTQVLGGSNRMSTTASRTVSD